MKEALKLILLRVSQSADIDEGELAVASRLIINSICEGLQISRASIWLYNETQSFIQRKLLIDKGYEDDHESRTLSREDFPAYFKALESQRSITANNAMTDPATSEFADCYLTSQDISSILDVPIRHRGKMIGIICCEHRGDARQWHAEEVVFSAVLADLYGRAVSANERCDYEAKLVQANQKLEQHVKERTIELETTLRTLEAAQDKLVESEKMAALGNLVAGVAHEVNTPLGIALTSVSNCIDELRSVYRAFENDNLTEQGFKDFNEVCLEGLTLAETSLMRAANLIKDFKRTSADQTSLEVETIVMDEYIPRVCNPLKPMLRKQRISLSLDITPGLTVTTCPGIIAQLLTNLISNAERHAFEDEENNRSNEVTVTCKPSDKGVVISVRDNGKGIPKTLHKKVFEPFYTTAREKGGTGLGLNILYNLVLQKLDGEIELTSEPNIGTTVSLIIPKI